MVLMNFNIRKWAWVFFIFGMVWVPELTAASGEKILTIQLQTLIRTAIEEGADKLELEEGRFFIDTEVISISNIRHFTLSGVPGKTVLVSHALRPIFFVENSKNITIKNLAVDYDPLPFTQGPITAVDREKREIRYTVHTGYPDLNGPFATTTAFFFDGKTRRWKRGVTDGYYQENRALTSTNGRLAGPVGIASAVSNESYLQVGDLVVFPVRRSAAILFSSCENVRVEGVEIYSAPGDAILCRYMRGDNYFRFTVRPGPRPFKALTDRLLSASAGGLRYSVAEFGPTVEDSLVASAGDNGITIYGPAFPVTAADGMGFFWMAFPSGNMAALLPLLAKNEPMTFLSYGDFSPYQTFPADSIRVDGFGARAANSYIKTLYRLGENVSPGGTYARVKPLASGPGTVGNYRKPALGDLVIFPRLAADGFQIRRSRFQHLRGHGVRVASSRGEIEENEFQGLRFSAIQAGPDFVPWAEAGWVHDLIIKNNFMADTGFDPSMTRRDARAPGAIVLKTSTARFGQQLFPVNPPHFHSNILIVGNEIHLSGASGIWLDGVSGARIESNTILRNGLRLTPETGASNGIWADEAINVLRGENVGILNND